MTLTAVRHLEPAESLLADWDARWKLAGVLLLTLAISLTRSWEFAWAGVASAVLLAAAGSVPRSWFATRMAGLAVGVLPFVIILPWTLEGGLPIAVSIAGRALAIGALALTLLATSPLQDTCAAAHSLRAPGVLVQLTLMTYRYIFLIADQLKRIDTALRARGFRNRFNRHSLRTIGRVTGSLLVRSQDRADNVARAMACRGFDGRFRTVTRFRTRLRDVAIFAILAIVALALWAGDRWLRG